MELRPYQISVLNAIKNHIKYRPTTNGYVVAPGGSGKSLMIAKTAEHCHDNGLKVTVLTRSEKLASQNREKISSHYPVGMYSAAHKQYDHHQPITVATIQSISKLRYEHIPKVFLIDECHALHPDPESDTQLWNFIRDCFNPLVIGFTATDFRTASGKIAWGDEIINIPIKPLFDAGYIVPPTNKATQEPDLSDVTVRLGEYALGELSRIYENEARLFDAVESIKKYAVGRKSIIVFAQSRKHARLLTDALNDNAIQSSYVDGDLDKRELNTILESFKAGETRCIVNCQLLTEGYDLPCTDMIVVLRSTMSKGLFEQMLYRGTRPSTDKKDFLVLDMGGNFKRHGALGSPIFVGSSKGSAPRDAGRICPCCETFIPGVGIKECPDCAYIFIENEARKVDHDSSPDMESTMVYNPIETHIITDVRYAEHKSNKSGNTSLKVSYFSNYGKVCDEWIAPFSSSDWARNKAWHWFKDRGKEIYGEISKYHIDDLLFFCQELKKPIEIQVNKSEKFPRVVGYRYELEGGSGDTARINPLDLLAGDEIVF